MITISGVDVVRDNHSFPTLYDVGYSLSQLPRFNGYTTERYSVLHHLIGCWQYAKLRGEKPGVCFYVLVHDVAEAVTNDICPPWKTDDTKELQRQLDERFYASLKIRGPDGFTARIVKAIDSQMVYAEAKAFAPQVAQHILKPGPNFREGINTTDPISDEAVVFAKFFWANYGPDQCGLLFKSFVEEVLQNAQL